jgi:two-component system response regulator (stage 0 sporulation protein F)
MKKILIVDDDYANRLLYQEEFTVEGYEVITANTCEGLLETIARHLPNLIILSFRRAEGNELDTLDKIREANYEIPVFLSTEYLPVGTVHNLLQKIEESRRAYFGEVG